jgi:hypothetical protein
MGCARILVVAAVAGAFFPDGATAADRGLVVSKTAIYGLTANTRTCNAMGRVAQLCENRTACDVHVDNNLCGDPAPGRIKQLLVEWECSDIRGETRFDVVKEGGTMRISCEAEG